MFPNEKKYKMQFWARRLLVDLLITVIGGNYLPLDRKSDHSLCLTSVHFLNFLPLVTTNYDGVFTLAAFFWKEKPTHSVRNFCWSTGSEYALDTVLRITWKKKIVKKLNSVFENLIYGNVVILYIYTYKCIRISTTK